jgi:hypothetical protein
MKIYLLKFLIAKEKHIGLIAQLPESHDVAPNGAHGDLLIEEELAEVLERSVQVVHEPAVVVVRDAHVLGVAADVDDLGLDGGQLSGKQLPGQMRLDEAGRGHVLDDVHGFADETDHAGSVVAQKGGQLEDRSAELLQHLGALEVEVVAQEPNHLLGPGAAWKTRFLLVSKLIYQLIFRLVLR